MEENEEQKQENSQISEMKITIKLINKSHNNLNK